MKARPVERTIFDLFRHDVEHPRTGHYTYWTPEGRREWSTAELLETTAALSEGLAQLGVRRGRKVVLLSDNRPEWHALDLAVVSLGAVDVPVYGTLTVDQLAFQARDSGATVAIADSAAAATRLLAVRDAIGSLRHIVQIDGTPVGDSIPLTALVESGQGGGTPARFWRRAARASEDDPVTVIYTSGTTGVAKGVVLTHRNLVQNVLAASPRVPVGRDDVALEFLPLCHVLERMLGYAYMYRATYRAYCSVYHVGELIARIGPTVFAAVPRFFEKVHDTALARAGASPASGALVRWAIDVGLEVFNRRNSGRPVPGVLELQRRAAETLVFAKVRAALGGRVRFCISGGAALPLAVNRFFHAVGVPVLEGYGLTETSPVIAVNGAATGELRLGTVGRPLPNVEVKVAADGELLVRGPTVTSGYLGDPLATAEAFDAQGFFHTGDIAELDDDGFLLITDRKKEIIVTAGGKNVAPQAIEAELKREPLIDVPVVIGDGRPFLVALLTPNLDEVRRIARVAGPSPTAAPALVESEAVQRACAAALERVNARLARFEQVKRWRMLPSPFTVEAGQLTPTLKVRRRVIEEQFAGVIDALYAGPPA